MTETILVMLVSLWPNYLVNGGEEAELPGHHHQHHRHIHQHETLHTGDKEC